MAWRRSFSLVVLLTGACSADEVPRPDGGDAGTDGGGSGTDGGGSGTDTGMPPGDDSGTPAGDDSGTPPGDDSGIPPGDDSGTPPDRDAGPTDRDAGGPPPGDRPIGAACANDAECAGDAVCLMMLEGGFGMGSITFPGGYCTQRCGGGFPGGGTPCPEGSTCVGGADYCAHNCMSDADCRASEGYHCMGAFPFGASYCTPPTMMMGGDGGWPFP